MDCRIEGRTVAATVHENGLGTEHLGDLGEDGRAAMGDEPVGEAAKQRVGGDAAKTVGAATLEPDAELGDGDVLPHVLGGDRIYLSKLL